MFEGAAIEGETVEPAEPDAAEKTPGCRNELIGSVWAIPSRRGGIRLESTENAMSAGEVPSPMRSARRTADRAGTTLLLLACLLAGCDAEPDAMPEVLPLVPVTRVTDGCAPLERTLPGRLAAAERTELAFEVAGPVADVRIDLGDRFEAGAVLATLEDTDARERLAANRAELADVRAGLADAERDLGRQRELLESGMTAPARVDAAEARAASLRARRDRARARVALAREALGDTRLTAPWPGSVTARRIEPGQQVAPGMTVFDVQRASTVLEVQTDVPEALRRRLLRDVPHAVRVPAVGGSWDARISQLGDAGRVAGSFPVQLLFEADDASVRPGMAAVVDFRVGPGIAACDAAHDRRALRRVPRGAVAGRDGDAGYVLLVRDADDGGFRVARREVRIVSIVRDALLVQGDVPVGAEVVIRGAGSLADGTRVELRGRGVQRFEDGEP